MSAQPSDVQVLAEAVADVVMARLEARLTGLASARQSRVGDIRLLSLRAAARLLGVSRCRTLPNLIAERKLKTVTIAGRVKVPRSEIDRIEREGASQVAGSRRRRLSAPDDAPLAAEEMSKV